MHKLRGNHAQAQRGWSSKSDKARRLAFDMDQDKVVDSCLMNPTFVKTRLNMVGQKKTRRPVLTGRVGGREAGGLRRVAGRGPELGAASSMANPTRETSQQTGETRLLGLVKRLCWAVSSAAAQRTDGAVPGLVPSGPNC